MSNKEATQLASKLGISVQKYAQSVSNLEKMLPKFDNARGGAMRKQVIQLDKSTNDLGNEIDTELKKLGDIKSSDDEVLELQLKQLNSKYSDAKKKFDVSHKTILEKETVYIEEDEKFKKEEAEALKLGKVAPKNSLMRREHEEQMAHLQKRDESLKNLEKDGVELHGLMKDVSGLITEQGKVLDNIDNNVEAAKNDTHEGVEHIEQASIWQKAARQKKMIMGIVLLVILIIVIVFVATKTGSAIEEAKDIYDEFKGDEDESDVLHKLDTSDSNTPDSPDTPDIPDKTPPVSGGE